MKGIADCGLRIADWGFRRVRLDFLRALPTRKSTIRISHFAILSANHLQHGASIGNYHFFVSTVPPQVERSSGKAVV